MRSFPTLFTMSSGLITCFFDPVHQIRPERMQIHLYKCKKQHPLTPFKICPLNSTHYVKPEDFEAHMEDCPDKGGVMAHILAKNCYRFDAPKPVDRDLPDVNEWQEVQGRLPFNPTMNAKSKNVVRVLKAACKSEKKRFYEAEELRHQTLAANPGRKSALPNLEFRPLRAPRPDMSIISESPWENGSVSTLKSTSKPRIEDEVKRIEYMITEVNEDYIPWSLERECSAECKPFCVNMGTRTKVNYCTSCCTENHCNVDNSSISLISSIWTDFLLPMSICILLQIL